MLAEKEAWEERVIGVSFDGTGYGDDGSTWGREFFAGSMTEGFRRVLHMRLAFLAGGDASARHPVQCDTPASEVVRGRELMVAALELAE